MCRLACVFIALAATGPGALAGGWESLLNTKGPDAWGLFQYGLQNSSSKVPLQGVRFLAFSAAMDARLAPSPTSVIAAAMRATGPIREDARAADSVQFGDSQTISVEFDRANRFGISGAGGAQRDPRYQALLPTMRELGFGWVRIGLNPGLRGWEGKVDWPDKDPQIRNARNAKLAILGELQIGNKPGPIDGWASYVRQVVERYRADIHYWEIWNEPDLSAYWKGTAADYAELLAVAYQTIKASDKSATVLFGGLALNDEPWKKSDGGFLGRVLADPVHPGIKNFDVANFHHYGAIALARQRMTFVRAQLAAHGRPGVPVWVTEAGHGSAPSHHQTARGYVGDEGQVRWMKETLPILLDELGAEKVFWYQALDSDAGGRAFATHGLYTNANPPRAKPVVFALRDLIKARKER